MIFNKLTGTGAQEIILVKRAISKIKSLLNNKQDKFANIGEDEQLNKVLVPAGEYDVILTDDFKAQTSATTEDSNNIVNVEMLRGYHDNTKQDKLTAGSNIIIDEDNVISASGGGETWRDIISYEIPIDETTVADIQIAHDSGDNAFALKKAKIFMYVPQDSQLQSALNGYFILYDEASTPNDHTYGAINYVRTSSDNFIYLEIECFGEDIPTVAKICDEALGVAPQNQTVSFGINLTSAAPYSAITKFRFNLNSGVYPVGTKIKIMGVDA